MRNDAGTMLKFHQGVYTQTDMPKCKGITEWKVKVLCESRRIIEEWRSKTESQVRLYGNV
ncbi:hypothetical protein Hanom_Chr11g00981851 [Helianthus anomalus]